jgi:siroheme synthase-like protein
MVDLTGRLTVVVGGGPVGRRKAQRLLSAGAIVRLVCLEPRPPEMNYSHLVWLTEAYHADHLAGATLVFAAATPEINRQVAADAKRRGILVNRADDSTAGDFVVPATHREGDLVVAVSTGGAAPTLAKRLRDRLADRLEPEYVQWVALLRELRPLVAQTIPDPDQRRELYESWADLRWLEALRQQGPQIVRQQFLADLRGRSGSPLE